MTKVDVSSDGDFATYTQQFKDCVLTSNWHGAVVGFSPVVLIEGAYTDGCDGDFAPDYLEDFQLATLKGIVLADSDQTAVEESDLIEIQLAIEELVELSCDVSEIDLSALSAYADDLIPDTEEDS